MTTTLSFLSSPSHKTKPQQEPTGSTHQSGGTGCHGQRQAGGLCQVSKPRDNPARRQQVRRGQRFPRPSKLDWALGLKPPHQNLPQSRRNGTALAMGEATPLPSAGEATSGQGRWNEGVLGTPAPQPLAESAERGRREGRGLRGKAGARQQHLGTSCHRNIPAMRVPSRVGTPPVSLVWRDPHNAAHAGRRTPSKSPLP